MSAAAKILVIDDDPGVMRALTARLRRDGFVTLSAMDAVQGTMFARRESPAVIVLDLNLPGGDGLRVLENLGRTGATAAIPVLIFTGSSEPELFERARELGALDCFVKGVDAEPLLERIRSLAAGPGDAQLSGGSLP